MSQGNSDQFGARVLAAMGASPEFTAWPSLRPTLHLAASWAWDDYTCGDYGAPDQVNGATLAVRAGEIADDLVGRNDNLGDVGWNSRPLRTAFAEIVAAEFERSKGGRT